MEITIVQVDKCEKCLNPIKSVHQCEPLTVQEPSNNIIIKVNHKTVSNCKEEDFMEGNIVIGKYKKNLPAEKKESLLKIHNDVVQTKVKLNLTSCLINAIKVRRPLFDGTERYQFIKNKLWIEVYNELKGQIPISKLRTRWSYLKQKYVSERQIQKKGGIKSKWKRYDELSFLEKIEIKSHVKKTANNSDLNLDKYSEDSPQNLTTAKNTIRKEKNDNNLQRDLLNEHTIAARQTEVIEEPEDSDDAFGKYLVALMKDLPIKKRKTLQCQFIESVITAQYL